ncbi:MAG: helicase HerA-like domain-containing protein, partial [Planctomycetota bacterium]
MPVSNSSLAIDSKNHFFLGRDHDLATGETDDQSPLMYSSKDLTTHAVCVGMTGSGKTGLCLSLIEEALLDGVPVIAIDPKGDLGNLLLAFDDLA